MSKINYGSWVPKPILYAIGIFGIILIIVAILVQELWMKFVFFFFSFFFISLLAFLLLMYYFMNRREKEFQHLVWDLIIQKANWSGGGKALDIGTGAGALAIKLAQNYADLEVVGLDNWGIGWEYSKKQCETNAKIAGVSERINFIKGSAANLPFEDAKFDLIVSNFVFHEVREVRNKLILLKEALRVLKPNGKFVIQDEIYNRRIYGDPNNFLNNIQKLDVQDVYLEKTNRLIKFNTFFLKLFVKGGLLWGKKRQI